jgi:hypothetical protein
MGKTDVSGLLGNLAKPNRHALNRWQNVEMENPDLANQEIPKQENVEAQNPESSFPVLPLAWK